MVELVKIKINMCDCKKYTVSRFVFRNAPPDAVPAGQPPEGNYKLTFPEKLTDKLIDLRDFTKTAAERYLLKFTGVAGFDELTRDPEKFHKALNDFAQCVQDNKLTLDQCWGILQAGGISHETVEAALRAPPPKKYGKKEKSELRRHVEAHPAVREIRRSAGQTGFERGLHIHEILADHPEWRGYIQEAIQLYPVDINSEPHYLDFGIAGAAMEIESRGNLSSHDDRTWTIADKVFGTTAVGLFGTMLGHDSTRKFFVEEGPRIKGMMQEAGQDADIIDALPHMKRSARITAARGLFAKNPRVAILEGVRHIANKIKEFNRYNQKTPIHPDRLQDADRIYLCLNSGAGGARAIMRYMANRTPVNYDLLPPFAQWPAKVKVHGVETDTKQAEARYLTALRARDIAKGFAALDKLDQPLLAQLIGKAVAKAPRPAREAAPIAVASAARVHPIASLSGAKVEEKAERREEHKEFTRRDGVIAKVTTHVSPGGKQTYDVVVVHNPLDKNTGEVMLDPETGKPLQKRITYRKLAQVSSRVRKFMRDGEYDEEKGTWSMPEEKNEKIQIARGKVIGKTERMA